jgi:hypothetical protein
MVVHDVEVHELRPPGKRVTRFRTALATAQIALSMALCAAVLYEFLFLRMLPEPVDHGVVRPAYEARRESQTGSKF